MTELKTLLAAGALGLTLAATAAQAAPPLWVIKDADSTIYLMGSVHILRPQTQWRSPAIDAAMASSTELWLEIVEPEDPAQMSEVITPLMMQYGISFDRPLSSRLSPAEQAQLRTAIAPLAAQGIDAAALEMMKPWLVATMLSVGPLQAAGYDPTRGVEPVLTGIARGQNDAIKGFEGIDQQLRIIATLPDDVQLEFLRSTLEDLDVREMDDLVTAWNSGNLAALERETVEMKTESPRLYERLLVQRNEDWAGQIETRLKGSGVSFIAVGAAHLVGPDSVQARLKARGIEAEIQP